MLDLTIIWHGHSCFEIRGSVSVVFDPFEPGYVPGFQLPQLSADYCFCSHGHGDHSYSKGVTVPSAPPALTSHFVDTFHDTQQGAQRGPNRITIVEIDGKTIAHMGDIGHILSEEQIAAVGPVDVLLLPVGGFFTVDAPTAKKIAESLNPGIVIPMHYRGGGFGFDVISTLEDYTSLCNDVIMIDSNQFDPDSVQTPCTVVLAPPVC